MQGPTAPLSDCHKRPKSEGVTGAALLVIGCIPVALSNSEGAGSVLALAWLPGAHLYKQVLGNERTKRLRAGPSHPSRNLKSCTFCT